MLSSPLLSSPHSLSFTPSPTPTSLMELTIALLSLPLLLLCFRALLSASNKGLPPGPPGWPIVGNLFQVLLHRRHFIFVVRDLRRRFGPIFTMKMGQRTMVIVTSPDLIHQALVLRGPTFASRPPDSPIRLMFSIGKCAVNSAVYGPLWRALRRNFVTEIMSPVKVKQYSWIRNYALDGHVARILEEFERLGYVDVMATCRFTVCSILVGICFGAKISKKWTTDIDDVTKAVMLMTSPQLPDFLPVLTPLFRSQVKKATRLRTRQMNCFLPLINKRRAFVRNGERDEDYETEMVSPVGGAYVDSLFDLQVPTRGSLGDQELVTLCTEVFVAGIDTTTSALQWAFFELVVNQQIQEKLYEEIERHVGCDGAIGEDDVEKMEYLNAVVKETLRLHSPAHFTLSHATTEDTELAGYKIPKNANVEFYIEAMTEDPDLWKDPEVFRPERFLGDGEGADVELTGTKGSVKMLPFGAGRRTCPGLSLGLLHVNLMLARMVQKFKWMSAPGFPPDPTEIFAFTVVMKNPLRAVVSPRRI